MKLKYNFFIILEFQNDVAKFYCSVYFAEQFRQLREQIFPEGEERFESNFKHFNFSTTYYIYMLNIIKAS